MENLLPRQKPLKKYLPILGCIVLFALLSLAYFNPVLSGKVLVQGDIQQFAGSAQEILPQILADTLSGCPVLTKEGAAV